MPISWRRLVGRQAFVISAASKLRSAQPMTTFAGEDLYPTVVEKAGALAFALIQGHALVDGNKRIGHAAMEVFLMLNGFEVTESVDEQERTVLAVASGRRLVSRLRSGW